jgi:hypothetical protein
MAAREIMAGIAAFLLYQFLRSAVMDSDDDDLSTAELMAIRALVKTTNETRSMVIIPVIGTGDDYITQLGTFTTAFKEGQTVWKLFENSFYYSSYELTGAEFAYERGYYQRDTDRYEEGDAKVLKNLHDLSGWSNFEDAFTEQRAAAKRAVKAK